MAKRSFGSKPKQAGMAMDTNMGKSSKKVKMGKKNC